MFETVTDQKLYIRLPYSLRPLLLHCSCRCGPVLVTGVPCFMVCRWLCLLCRQLADELVVSLGWADPVGLSSAQWMYAKLFCITFSGCWLSRSVVMLLCWSALLEPSRPSPLLKPSPCFDAGRMDYIIYVTAYLLPVGRGSSMAPRLFLAPHRRCCSVHWAVYFAGPSVTGICMSCA